MSLYVSAPIVHRFAQRLSVSFVYVFKAQIPIYHQNMSSKREKKDRNLSTFLGSAYVG